MPINPFVLRTSADMRSPQLLFNTKTILLLILTFLSGLTNNRAYAGVNDDAIEFTITTNADDYIGQCKGYLGGYVKLRNNFSAPYTYCYDLAGTLYLEKMVSGAWTILNTSFFSGVTQANFNYVLSNVPNADYFRVRVEFTAAKYGGVSLIPPPAGVFPDWLGETSQIAYYDLDPPPTTAPNAAYTINGKQAINVVQIPPADVIPCSNSYNMVLTSRYSATQYMVELTKLGVTYATSWAALPVNNVIPISTVLNAGFPGNVDGTYFIKLVVKDDCERYSEAVGKYLVYASNPLTPTLSFNVLNKTAATTSVSSRYNIYSCSPALTLSNTTGNQTSGYPYKYRLTLFSTNMDGSNPLAIGMTDWGNFPTDLRNLAFLPPRHIYGGWLNDVAHVGSYTIKIEVQDFCNPSAVLATANAYVQFSGPPTAPSTTLTIGGNYVDGDGNQTEAFSSTTTTANPLILCAGPDYYYFKCGSTSGVVTGYRKSTWQIAGGVYTNVVAGATTNTASLPGAGSSLFGSSGFAPLENVLYAFRLEVFNPCSSVVKEQYFKVVYSCKQAGGGTRVADAAEHEKDPASGITTTRMFPNPVKDMLTIQSALVDEHARISLFDMQGKQIDLPVNLVNNEATVNTSSLANGVYTVELSNKGQITRARFVK